MKSWVQARTAESWLASVHTHSTEVARSSGGFELVVGTNQPAHRTLLSRVATVSAEAVRLCPLEKLPILQKLVVEVVETGETPALTLESQINTRATAYCSKPDPRYRGSRAEHER